MNSENVPAFLAVLEKISNDAVSDDCKCTDTKPASSTKCINFSDQPVASCSSKQTDQMTPDGSTDDILTLISLKCTGKVRTWQGRNKIRKDLRHQQDDYLKLETLVSYVILQATGDTEDVSTTFDTVLSIHEYGTETRIQIGLQPTYGQNEFSCFYLFFKTLFTKAVEKTLCRISQ